VKAATGARFGVEAKKFAGSLSRGRLRAHFINER
jgi:hypothetical protein